MKDLQEIKDAVLAGKRVCWKNSGYVVLKPNKHDQWFIMFEPNRYCVGLTQRDGVTMNEKPEDFFIDEPKPFYTDPDYAAMHAAWATIKHARHNVDPKDYATAVDWHRVEELLRQRLVEHGAGIALTTPRGAHERP